MNNITIELNDLIMACTMCDLESNKDTLKWLELRYKLREIRNNHDEREEQRYEKFISGRKI